MEITRASRNGLIAARVARLLFVGALTATSLVVLTVPVGASLNPIACIDTLCGTGAVSIYMNGAATGGSVINIGRTASGGVVAVGLEGSASDAVDKISGLLTPAPTGVLDPSRTDYFSPVPGCNAGETVPVLYGDISLPLPKIIGNLKIEVLRAKWAGCNNPHGGQFHGTYADAFVTGCKATYTGSDAASSTIVLQADWYRDRSTPPNPYAPGNGLRPGDNVLYHREEPFEPSDRSDPQLAETDLVVADWASNLTGPTPTQAVLTCSAKVRSELGVETPANKIPQAAMVVHLPLE